jgi:hypothetical protein
MKATDFRIGNIVTVCYEDGKPDMVIIAEPGLIHLASRPHADDERDITGVPITFDKLSLLDFAKKSKGIPFEIDMLEADKAILTVSIGNYIVSCRYWHELQNLFFLITGEELIPFKLPPLNHLLLL